MAKSRSPNYPAVGLAEALKRAKILYGKEHRNKMDREAVASHLGYGGLTGASMPVISALLKYGLLEGRGDEIRISDDAVTLIVDTEESPERSATLRRAAVRPKLFAQMEKHYDGIPSENNAAIYLQKQGFTEVAAKKASRSYRETMRLVSESKVDDNGEKARTNRGRETETPKPQGPTFSQLLGFEQVPSRQAVTPSGRKPDPAPSGAFQMTLRGGNSLEVRVTRKLTQEEFEEIFGDKNALRPFLEMSLVQDPPKKSGSEES